MVEGFHAYRSVFADVGAVVPAVAVHADIAQHTRQVPRYLGRTRVQRFGGGAQQMPTRQSPQHPHF